MYANQVVYLCGQVVDLLCSSGRWEQPEHRRNSVVDLNMDYQERWSQLFGLLDYWYSSRSEEMKPLLTIPTQADAVVSKPFPTLLFANGPAVRRGRLMPPPLPGAAES